MVTLWDLQKSIWECIKTSALPMYKLREASKEIDRLFKQSR